MPTVRRRGSHNYIFACHVGRTTRSPTQPVVCQPPRCYYLAPREISARSRRWARRRQRSMPTALMSAIVVLGGSRRRPGRRERRELLAAGHLRHPGGGAVRPRPVDRHDLLFGRRQRRPLGELRARRPHRGRARHGVELHPADADLDIRAEGAGRPGLVRRHRAVGQLRLDRVGDPGWAVGPQRVRRARRFDDGVRRSLSRRPR